MCKVIHIFHAPVIIKLRKWFIITHVFCLALFVHIILPVESITVQETTTCRANNGCMLNQNITQHPIHRQKEKLSETRTKKRRWEIKTRFHCFSCLMIFNVLVLQTLYNCNRQGVSVWKDSILFFHFAISLCNTVLRSTRLRNLYLVKGVCLQRFVKSECKGFHLLSYFITL